MQRRTINRGILCVNGCDKAKERQKDRERKRRNIKVLKKGWIISKNRCKLTVQEKGG